MGSRRGVLVGATTCALMWTGAVAAPAGADERGVDPHQGENLVEVHLPSKAAAMRLQLEAERTASTSTSTTCARAATGR